MGLYISLQSEQLLVCGEYHFSNSARFTVVMLLPRAYRIVSVGEWYRVLAPFSPSTLTGNAFSQALSTDRSVPLLRTAKREPE